MIKIVHFRSPDSEFSILVDKLEGIAECFKDDISKERLDTYIKLAGKAFATKTIVTDFNSKLTIRVIEEPLWG